MTDLYQSSLIVSNVGADNWEVVTDDGDGALCVAFSSLLSLTFKISLKNMVCLIGVGA